MDELSAALLIGSMAVCIFVFGPINARLRERRAAGLPYGWHLIGEGVAVVVSWALIAAALLNMDPTVGSC